MASKAVFKKLLEKKPQQESAAARKKRKRLDRSKNGPTRKTKAEATPSRYFASESPSKKSKQHSVEEDDEEEELETVDIPEVDMSAEEQHEEDLDDSSENSEEIEEGDDGDKLMEDNGSDEEDSSPPAVFSMDDDEDQAVLPVDKSGRTASTFDFNGKVIPFASEDINTSKTPTSILLFYRNEKFYFHGALSLRVIQGSVSVFGFNVSSSKDQRYYPVFSPFSANAISIESVGHSPVLKPEPIKKTKLTGENLEINKALLKASSSISWEKVVAVAVVRALATSHLSSAELFLFPHSKQRQTAAANHGHDSDESGSESTRPAAARAVSKFYDPLKLTSTHVIRVNDGAYQLTSIPESWLSLKQQLLLSFTSKQSSGAVLVCGKKNVGKSSLARYLVNSLLSKTSAVAFLECDVGQTELTPPGMVSLSLVHEPLLGQPFTHVNTRAATLCRAQFIGDTSPKNNPEHFVQSVFSLYDYYLNEIRNSEDVPIPLVINTHGWIQGTGYDMLLQMIEYIQPARVVEIYSYQDPTTSGGHSPTPLAPKKPINPHDLKNIPNYQPHLHSVLAVSSHPPRLSLTSEQKRQYQMLAYFDIGDQLFGMRSTYRVPMASMRVHFMDSEVLPSQSLLALNASVVALVADDSTTVVFNGGRNTMSRQLPQFLLSSPTARSSSCLGLGVIKSIDIEQQVLYIVTPVAAEQLKGVNTIIKASLDLPQLVLVKDVTINTPYLTADSISSLGTGATHMKSRGNILRHRYDAKTNQ